MSDSYEMRGKLNFEAIYTANLPDDYFRELGRLRYRAPDSGAPLLHRHITYLRRSIAARRVTVVDLGASFGFTAMSHRTGLTFAQLAQRFAGPSRALLPLPQCLALDREFFSSHAATVDFVGIDRVSSSLRYADTVGLHRRSYVLDVEVGGPPPLDFSDDAVVLFSTGTIGYVGPSGIGRVIAALQADEIVGILVVARTLDLEPIARAVSSTYYVTTPDVPLRQRRFGTAEEQELAVDAARRVGWNTVGREEDGWVFATPLLFGDGPAYKQFITRLAHESADWS
jgi:hypothetical protein